MRWRVSLNGSMTSHRIKEIRDARGMSQKQLGARIGRTKSVISRLEDGSTSLDLEVARKVAQALDCSLSELLALETEDRGRVSGGIADRDDLTFFEQERDERFPRPTGPNRYFMKVESDVVAGMGIDKDDRVEVDGSPEICKNPPALAAVRVQFLPDPSRPTHTISLLRQFVPPSKLITNSPRRDERPLDLERDNVKILGVITWSHKRFV